MFGVAACRGGVHVERIPSAIRSAAPISDGTSEGTSPIERFFVLVEESGSLEALKTAAGSAAVALLTYQIISWEPLQLTFFVYPELLAPVAAVQILLGRYTGYRISEFIRFRMFRKPS